MNKIYYPFVSLLAIDSVNIDLKQSLYSCYYIDINLMKKVFQMFVNMNKTVLNKSILRVEYLYRIYFDVRKIRCILISFLLRKNEKS